MAQRRRRSHGPGFWNQRPYLTPTEVAQLLRVSPVTVRHWALKGWLKAETTAGGHRRFLKTEVDRFARERGMSLQQPEDGTIRVLVVDDDPQFAGFVKEALTRSSDHVVVEVAPDGFEAGRLVQAFQPHVVLLDLVMPGIDGLEVCRRIKSEPALKAIRIVALTGVGTPEQQEEILAAGAEECLQKPISMERLLTAVGVAPEPRAAGASA